MKTTIEVKTELYSWIAAALGLSEKSTGILNNTLAKGTTLQAFLIDLAKQYPLFAEKVFNPVTFRITPRVLVMVNNKMVRGVDLARTVLHQGDVILLMPIIFGG
jgi:molybdopterin converting factor small subunit